MRNRPIMFSHIFICVALSMLPGCITIKQLPNAPNHATSATAGRRGALGYDPTKFDFYRDDYLIAALVNLSHGAVITASADQSKIPLRDGVAFLAGATLDREGYLVSGDAGRLNKSCRPWSEGKAALVMSSANVGRSYKKAVNNGKDMAFFEMDVNSSTQRIWSKTDGGTVSCDESARDASVNFLSPAGTRMELSFERTRPESRSIRGQRTWKARKNIKGTGKSLVTWSSNDSSKDTKKTYLRNSVLETIDSQYELTTDDKTGESRGMDVTVSTPGSSPLLIKTERDKKTNTVVSKMIVSGQTISKIATGEKMTITYNSLKINFFDPYCSIGGGTAKIVISDNKDIEIKTLILAPKSSSSGILKDNSGKEIEGFSVDRCDVEDLMN